MLRIPHCLDSRLIDGGEVSPTHQPCSTPKKHYFSTSGTNFCYRLSEPQGLVQLEGLVKLKKFILLIVFRTRDLPACSVAPNCLRFRVLLENKFKNIMTIFCKEDELHRYEHKFVMQCHIAMCRRANWSLPLGLMSAIEGGAVGASETDETRAGTDTVGSEATKRRIFRI
jgi:hypothetical protein